jgi:hypothetical protein
MRLRKYLTGLGREVAWANHGAVRIEGDLPGDHDHRSAGAHGDLAITGRSGEAGWVDEPSRRWHGSLG